MSPTDILARAWQIYRSHWKHLISVALVIFLAVALINAVLSLLGLAGFVLGQLVALAGGVLLQGALVTAVADVRDGRVDMNVRETIESVKPVFWTLLAVSLLAAIGIFIGFVALIIPGLFLMTHWLLVAPAVVLERRTVGGAFSRSWELVRGHAWATFGVIILTIVLLFVAGVILGVLLSSFPEGLQRFLSTIIGNSLLAPFVAVAWTLTYFTLRELKGEQDAPAPPPEPATF